MVFGGAQEKGKTGWHLVYHQNWLVFGGAHEKGKTGWHLVYHQNWLVFWVSSPLEC
jgi:hypothetical protein